MRTPSWSLAGLFACTLPAACADPCLDDGLGQSGGGNCPAVADGTDTEAATESNSNTNTMTDTMASATIGSNTDSMSGSQTADDTATETAGGMLWCVDADGDGFGDPDMCTQSDDMPPGTVGNDDDCDDENPNTFPGAAQNETPPDQCMNDDDDDGWGDDGMGDDPLPPGVVPGSDCDDENPNAFPGAAENETPPDQCTVDEDGDGWGDANPGGGGGGGGGGPVSGSDCYDENPSLNPDTLQLTTFLPFSGGPGAARTLNTVDATNASIGDFLLLLTPGNGIPQVNLVSATFNEDMEIYANDLYTVQLQTVTYAKTCGDNIGTVTPLGTEPYGPGGDIVCGLEFGGNGLLYGIGQTGDDLRSFDQNTGEEADAVPLTLDGDLIDIVSCGMARDCTSERLLVANGLDRSIYAVGTDGELELVRDLSAEITANWNPTGLEYDPVTRTVLLSIGTELWRVDINDLAVPAELVGVFEDDVSNLQYLPICI